MPVARSGGCHKASWAGPRAWCSKGVCSGTPHLHMPACVSACACVCVGGCVVFQCTVHVQIQEARYRAEQQKAAEDAFANRLVAEDEAALMQQTLSRTAQRDAERSIAQTLDAQVLPGAELARSPSSAQKQLRT